MTAMIVTNVTKLGTYAINVAKLGTYAINPPPSW